MMALQFIACDGVLAEDGKGVLTCSTGFSIIPEQAIYAPEMTADDFVVYWGITISLFAVAVGIKYLRKVFEDNSGRNA